MTASTSVNSNALNFMSCLKGGVDPRTGLYTVAISLPEFQSNDLRGPGLNLGLSYSPLNTLDIGFGMGWTMQLSEYNPGNQVLALSTGETFKVTGTETVPGTNTLKLLMEEQKLVSFNFYQDASDRYRVMHKSGMVEILQVRGNILSNVALPIRVLSASGHGITLDYLPFSTTHQRLDSIKDDLGTTLLEVKRDEFSVEYVLRPYDGVDGEPLARFFMTLIGRDKRVTMITLPTENKACWRFEYGSRNDQVYIEKVETPAGGREEIYYLDSGHYFPDSAQRPPLPRVTKHVVFPGFNQPAIDVHYTYEGMSEENRPVRNNFLGVGLNIDWRDDGRDNLYKNLNEYDYFCIESLHEDGKLEPVRSIERKFNRFHLQTREVTTQGNHVQTQKTTYNLLKETLYKDQPVDCQLPRQIETSWQMLNDATHSRFETVSSTYDAHGNLHTRTRADGVVEQNVWYPATCSDGCPANPEGFVRHLKAKTVTPAPSLQSGAPTLCTRYRYTSLGPIAGSELADMVVPESETLVQLLGNGEELQLQQNVFDMFNLREDPLLHGRVQSEAETINGKSTFTTYTYQTYDSPQLQVPVLETTQTLSTDFDSASKTILQQQSTVTAQELLSVVDGVETRRAYDALNRVTREIIACDTEFEAIREYEYTLCSQMGDQAEEVVFNARGAMTRTLFDGLGRRIGEEQDRLDSDDPGRVRKTYAAQYDALGQLQTETNFDWLENDELALTLTYRYDDWGQQACVIAADGVETHQQYDPIGTPETSFTPIQRNWVQSAGPKPVISGRSETWFNVFGKVDQSMSLDAAENVLGTQTFLYDGLGRCTQQTDELEFTTRFSYDPWSRMVSTVLPDTSVISREYASHSSAEWPTVLRVQHPNGGETLAGEQVFDGLGRMTQVKVGKRIEHYTYDGDRTQVKSRTTPAGQIIEFDYNLTLTAEPVSSTAPDEKAEFTYNKTSARLTRAANSLGERRYDYDALNRLRGEQWLDSQDKLWETTYVTSSRGRQLRRTELQQGSNAGLDTVYHYDTLGRVEAVDQGNIQSAFRYDPLGQLDHITTRDLAAGTTLDIDVRYDDQGREVHRTLTQDSHAPFTLEQQWRIDGQLETRHLQQGGTSLLAESFRYDSRGRLTIHSCSGSQLPRDSEGRLITQQIFSFDALDNIQASRTTFADGTNERAKFAYENSDEPCQLTGIVYSPERTAPNPTFSYDLNGNQLNDERGQQLQYDSQSRLLRVEQAGQLVSEYRYDGHDHLVTSRHGSTSETLRFYQDQQMSSSVQDDQQRHYLFLDDQPLAQQQADDVSQTLLLLTDPNRSVLAESQQNDLRTAVYSAYGERHSDDEMLSDFGYNGELRESSNGWYLLGRGYRAYNPGLMRFHSPDSLSPFGAGGLNPYTYCLGNPIALRDPTGHDASGQSGRLRRPDEDVLPPDAVGGGWMSWVFVAIGVVGSIGLAAATVASFGTAAPITVPLLNITIPATTVKVITVASLATATALTVSSTGAGAYAAVTGDKTAEQISQWTGIAAIPFGMVGGWLRSSVKSAIKAGANTARGAAGAAGRGIRPSISPFLSPHVSPGGGRNAAFAAGPGVVGNGQLPEFGRLRMGRFRFVTSKPAPPSAAPTPSMATNPLRRSASLPNGDEFSDARAAMRTMRSRMTGEAGNRNADRNNVWFVTTADDPIVSPSIRV